MPITLADLRRFAVDRSFFTPTTLKRALQRLGFVQADPIRAPARAQDLTLRHRVKNYRAGDLERGYAELGLEEDFFVTYGFVTKSLQALMHPRSDIGVPAEARRGKSLDFRLRQGYGGRVARDDIGRGRSPTSDTDERERRFPIALSKI